MTTSMSHRGVAAYVSQAMKRHADTLFTDAVATAQIPGVIAVATDRDGVIYEGAFGQRVLGGAPMTLDTVVWIASMTKAITAAAAMQLVEQGRLTLDAPVSDYLPALSQVRVLTGWDTQGQPVTRAPRRPITLRHCLTHSAGWGYELWNTEVARYQSAKGLPGIGSGMNKALETPLLFDPGERWQYGIGIDWAGKIVESVTGRTLGDYLTRNLLRPLGMNDTAFKIRPDMRARLAKVHARGADNAFTPTDFEVPQSPEFEIGGGGLYSTSSDYLKFVRMILNSGRGNGNQVLRPDTVELMSRNAMGELKVTALKSVLASRTNDAEFFPGMDKSWGLSFMINNERAPTGRSAGSLAWAGLANTYYWIDRSAGVGGVFLTQVLPFADERVLALFHEFESCVYRDF